MTPLRIILILALLTSGPQAQGASGEAVPLFASDELLEITIVAPLTDIMNERFYDEDFAGTITYVDDKTGAVTLDVGLRTRGRYRRQANICKFAPLRINFKKSTTDDTVFAGSNKLKMVTHCQHGSDRYMRSVLREYLAYRILNLVTERSFRVRLLRVTYVDTNSDKERSNYAFLIEHENQLGKRIDLKASDAEQSEIHLLDGPYTNLASVFHFLIGNTDFSPIRAAEGRPCCHNNALFGNVPGEMIAVPYDFDMTGLADAPHTATNPRFNLRNAKQRLYRGRCRNNAHLDASAQAFIDRKQAIFDLVENLEVMSQLSKKRVSRFLTEFFRTIEKPAQRKSKLARRCI